MFIASQDHEAAGGCSPASLAGAICNASLTPAIGRAYLDLKTGMFYRRGLDVKATKKLQPTIRVPDKLLAHIRLWAKLGECNRAVIEFDGEPVKRVTKAFARLVKDVGLKDVSPHVLRHTAVSWAMQEGENVYKVSKFFGMSVKMIETVYGHLHPDNQSVGDAIAYRRRGKAA